MDSLLQYLPQQWVGIVAILLIAATATTKLIEKFESLAKVLPFGTWWHERKKQRRRISTMEISTAIETARKTWISDDNVALTALERRLSSIAKTSENQASDIRELQTIVRAFTAWSTYDARWHHRLVNENVDNVGCVIPPHRDFFEFELVWRTDPYKASL